MFCRVPATLTRLDSRPCCARSSPGYLFEPRSGGQIKDVEFKGIFRGLFCFFGGRSDLQRDRHQKVRGWVRWWQGTRGGSGRAWINVAPIGHAHDCRQRVNRPRRPQSNQRAFSKNGAIQYDKQRRTVSAEPKVYEFSRTDHAANSSFLFLRLPRSLTVFFVLTVAISRTWTTSGNPGRERSRVGSPKLLQFQTGRNQHVRTGAHSGRRGRRNKWIGRGSKLPL